ncbi:hydantoinase/oxoprolinase family protein [Xanthobacter oligotrophicus]|uniref:hydantoinase/oxoprolinase family protein n=1 Tax=Xanthobacter oligotrophicus TaxID=2607286 RepID=UPI0011F3E56F|nr:hydantoinase/oxoprolinase family protein [Xanthobacter oligotrophicus]MCG5234704.1 hydantoinase/oxoprolinase family protein [Xanthobacter oligotrophicus]
MSTAPIRIAVDIGGTFTDIEILDAATGEIHQMKTPSTPSDPSIGLLTGIREASERFGFSLDQVQYLLHGTTIATNAVLERKLPLGAVVTTAGFEDVMQIGRHGRTDVYAITASPPPALVKRRLSFGVPERIGADGRIITALDEAAVEALAGALIQSGVKSVAVCFLNAYANAVHERRAGEILRALLPGVEVSLSCDISPELREYERMSTTLLNALLVPVVKTYTDRLAGKLKEEVPQTQVYLVQSNGGVAGLGKAGREPARLLLSGPSGGAAAARRLSAALDEPNLVAVDMGGTSFDVSVVHDGVVSMVNEGDVDGLPVRLPMIEMRTIGAGGGSIAWVDDGGRLRIGPHSAGAEPGPACYGRGGERLTVTDANLLLGRLDGSSFMGGRMGLDRDAAGRAAVDVAGKLKLSPEETAAGVIAVTNSSLATAIRLSLFEKGMDPEDFALLSFGGAGGVHACEVAEELGMNKVIFPAHASTLSAWGILWSDITHDLASTQIGLLADIGPSLADRAVALAKDGDRLLAEDGVAAANRAFEWALDLRYQGQAFDLRVQLPEADFSPEGIARAAAAFHALHRQRFSYDEPAVPVEVVALRLSAVGRLAKPTPAPATGAVAGAEQIRPVYGRGGFVETRVVAREAVTAEGVAGPAVVEEVYTATYLPAGWTIRSHATGALVAERTQRH